MRVLAGLLSVVFLMAGSAKVTGQADMLDAFARFGLPVWFLYFIGSCQLAGGIGLFIPKLMPLAASGLLIIMAGAAGTHFLFDPMSAAIPAIALGVLLGVVVLRSWNPSVLATTVYMEKKS